MRIRPFALERYFAQHEFEVQHSLCSSDCESLAVSDVLALEPGVRAQFDRLQLSYTESPGNPSLRREICGLYRTIAPEQVLVHTGAEEAIFLFMHAVLAAGDHVIVHWPCYQSLQEVARSIGCDVSPWQACEDAGWSLDVGDLERSIRPRTKAIIINTPHNPTGYHMSLDMLQGVCRFAQANGLLLFSDEVYRESEYQPQDRLPGACDLGDFAISLGVLSKTYGLAGLRTGWIATRNAEVYAAIARLKDYTTICNSAPSEFLAEIALRHRDQLAKRNVGIIMRNLDLLDPFFEQWSDRLAWQRPQAGPVAFPQLLGEEVVSFCSALAKTESVLLLPGTVFDDQENHFRIGFGREDLPEALARLDRFLRRSASEHVQRVEE